MGDPFLVEEVGLLALRSAVDEEQKQGQDFHALLLDTFSKLLELLTLRHRLIDASVASAYLAGLVEASGKDLGNKGESLGLAVLSFDLCSVGQFGEMMTFRLSVHPSFLPFKPLCEPL